MKNLENKIITSAVTKTSDIHIENSYSIRVKKEKQLPYVMIGIRMLLLATSVLTTIYCFITSLGIEVNHGKIIVGAICFSLIFIITAQSREYSLTITPSLMFIYVLYLYEQLDTFMEGFYHLENYVISAINRYYDIQLYHYKVAEADGVDSVTLLFLLVTFLLAWLYTYIIYSGNLGILYLTISIAVVAAPCLVGKLPNSIVFILHVITLIGMTGIFSVKWVDVRHRHWTGNRHMKNIGLSIGCLCMLIACACLIIANILVDKETYDQIPIEKWKKSAQQKIANLSKASESEDDLLEEIVENTGSVGGLEGGKLNVDSGHVKYTYDTQLKVTMVKPDTGIYLKGYTGVNYMGDSWELATTNQKEDYRTVLDSFEDKTYSSDIFSVLNLGCLVSVEENEGIKVMPSNITIEYVGANRSFLYYPYYTWFPLQEDELTEEYIYGDLDYGECYNSPQTKESSYSLRYYNTELPLDNLYEVMENRQRVQSSLVDVVIFDDIMESRLGEYSRFGILEENYRNYVYDMYLSLADSGLDVLIEDFTYYKEQLEKNSTMTQNGVDVLETIKFVRNYLIDHAEYSLNPGPTPEGKDFIEYFIYDNHKGYCSHYASAATIMLRVMGVPARYVEGYYISEESIEDAEVVSENSALGYDADGNIINIAGEANVFETGELLAEVRPEIEVEVDDTSAHAWVEVYIDGFGWIPVEFTEAYENGEITNGIQMTDTPTPTPTEVEEKEEEEPEVTEEPEEITQTPEPDKTESELATKDSQGNSQEGVVGQKYHVNWTIVKWFGIALALCAGTAGFHMYRLGIWRKYFRQYNRSQLYMLWYEKLEALRAGKNVEDNLQTKLTREDWEEYRASYFEIEYETWQSLREYYLKASYSKKELEKLEFTKAKKSLMEAYRVVNSKKSKLVQLWNRYIIYLYF